MKFNKKQLITRKLNETNFSSNEFNQSHTNQTTLIKFVIFNKTNLNSYKFNKIQTTSTKLKCCHANSTKFI